MRWPRGYHLEFARLLGAPAEKDARRRNPFGDHCPFTKTIRIDPTRGGLGNTLVHEALHAYHSDWSEARVRREAGRIWRRMTWREKAAVLRWLGRGVV